MSCVNVTRITCDQCGWEVEYPSILVAKEYGWSFVEDRDEPNDNRDLCAACFEEAR